MSIVLRANTDDLILNSGSAADLEVHLSAVQVDASTPPVPQPLPNLGPRASITGTGDTTILDTAGITSGHSVRVKHLSIYNNHGSTASVVTLRVDDGTDSVTLKKATLLAGESLDLTQAGFWLHYDNNGGVYPSVGNAASQAEMEAGTATDKYVTPQGVNWHPGAAKFWVKTTPGSVNAASYNVTSVTDTAAGITVVTIATDFSSAAWVCQCSCESTSDTMTVTNLKTVRIGLGDQAAGSVNIEVHDFTAITAVLEDPTSWHVAGFGDQ